MRGYFVFGTILLLLAANSYFNFYEIPYQEIITPLIIILMGILLFRNLNFLDKILGGAMSIFGLLKILVPFNILSLSFLEGGISYISLGILGIILFIKAYLIRVKIRKIGRDEVISCKGGNNVILSDFTKKHISEHQSQGKGSIFNPKINMSEIRIAIASISASNFNKKGGPGLVTLKIKNAGYNLVEKAKDIERKYNVISKGTTNKLEGKSKIQVPIYTIKGSLKKFKTNQFTVVIRPSNPEYMPENLKQDKGIIRDLQNGKSFSVLTAFPGDPNIPKASEWSSSGYAIIVLNKN